MGTVRIYNPDGSKHAFGTTTVVGSGVGSSVTIPSQTYSCGFNHTLTGKQTSASSMGGDGVNPYPDPGPAGEKYPGAGGGSSPTWEASTGGPVPKLSK